MVYGILPGMKITFELPPPLIRQLRADARTCGSTIIVVSGRVFPADRIGAERAGCDVFLPKPCLPQTLLSEVRRATERPDSREPRD